MGGRGGREGGDAGAGDSRVLVRHAAAGDSGLCAHGAGLHGEVAEPAERHVGARARWYVVEAAFADESKAVFLSRTILSDGYHQSEDRDKGAVKTVIRTSELPSASEAHQQVVFRVTPVGAFGKSGKSLVSEPISLPTP